ncbi:hypothetical protein [Azospirillum cavernae]|uniref:hypothetical protein n=1 Tax=Azospirillum cavernae TaxID=2320860 RepID=UPI001EE5DB3B|nr:hypothetical protein [Azospirillum cavernae]
MSQPLRRSRRRRPAAPPSSGTGDAGAAEGAARLFAEQDALLRDHRSVTMEVRRALAGPSSQAQRLALADDLLTLIDRLQAAKAALGRTILRGSAARTAVSAYGRVNGIRR